MSPRSPRLNRLIARMSRLAREKSNLQLVNNLMCSLGAIAGVDNVVDRVLQLLFDQLGGNNIALYYPFEGSLFYADVFGEKRLVESLDDDMVRRAFATGEAVEETRPFEATGMLTREFTRASYCALPLRRRDQLVAVVKLDGMLLDNAQVRGELKGFFEYVALVLQHEMDSHSHLRDTYEQLSRTHVALREEMLVRQREQQYLATVLDTIDAGIVACDTMGRITLFNDKAIRLYGGAPRSNQLEEWAEHTPHHRADGHATLPLADLPLFRALKGERVEDLEFRLMRADQPPRAVLASGRQVRDRAGRAIGAVVALQDITERQHLEVQLRLAQKLEAVGQLASGIAHEINTPTQFVSDNLQFLSESFATLRGLLDEYRKALRALEGTPEGAELSRRLAAAEAEADLAMIEDNVGAAFADAGEGVTRIKVIVNAMREFAHPAKRHKSPCDVNHQLATTLTIARNEYKYVADVEQEFGELPPVLAFANDLNQVFLNLLVNAAHAIEDAVRHTRRRGVIRLRTSAAGGRVRIEISDTGSGIPEAVRDRIFEPFFTTKEVGRGSGQGLAIARAIVVERHGGTLTFESEVGRGTTFVIELPVEAAGGAGEPDAIGAEGADERRAA
ncbi:MAG: ATP-binding protein [Candidatus Eisenbacteria bacterium]